MLLMIVLYTIASVWLTHWQKDFFDALQEEQYDSLGRRCLTFIGIMCLLFLSYGYGYYVTGLSALHWRRWLTREYLRGWLSQLYGRKNGDTIAVPDNPDQRLSQDIQDFPERTMTLLQSLLSSLLLLLSFSWLLWSLSGNTPLVFSNGFSIYIPGYLCWAALLWAILCSWITLKIAKPLVRLDYQQQQYMADYRRALLLTHEQADVALTLERKRQTQHWLRYLFKSIVRNYHRSIDVRKRYAFFNTFFLSGTTVVGALIGLPLFIQQHLQIGGLIQIASAFSQVSMALSFIVLRYPDIAEWQASTQRLYEFKESLQAAGDT
jgi:putative ATP-binding cassette transporter